ncbi:alpha/beta hydrolase [Nonomuraea sp. SBT364]|uniref:alpha/beta hydrolase n=1 Tax=Nonomuraea sp. SBT364 TaxID=1580530 RepID=UPI00066E8103|nr:alpha/beta fold hydrolase [Nonomuraea sp. SBT364]
MRLPDRVVPGLPPPFLRSQVDGGRPALALTPRGPVVSTDAWSGRHLALWAGGRWAPLTSGPLWHAEPRWEDGVLSAMVYDDLAAEQAVPRAVWPDGHGPVSREGHVLTHPVVGTVKLPPKVAVEDVATAPDRIAILLRRGRARRVVCAGRTWTCHWDGPVAALGPWLPDGELALVVESWPGRTARAWQIRTGALRPLTGPAPAVVHDVRRDGDLLALTWTSADQPRRLQLAELGGPPIRLRAASSPHGLPPAAHTLAGGTLPCVVRDPSGEPRGTVVLFHGGPNGANLATWSPLADSLALAGWRVVQPNLRGSRLLDPAVSAPLPELYGSDDVDDALRVLRETAVGPVVTGGLSYGGYLASRVALAAPEVRGAFLLCSFLRSADLREVEHAAVRAFLKTARFAPDDELPGVPLFVAHGDRDPRIPVEAVRAHLPRLHPDSAWTELAGEGHGMLTDEAAQQVFPQLFRWLDRLG